MKHSSGRKSETSYSGVLLCGGKGTRIASVTSEQGEVPKPLLEVGGRTLLRHTVELLGREAISQLVFAVDHQAGQIEGWVRAEHLEHDVAFTRQTKPGVLGAVVSAIPSASGDHVIIANTDEVRHGLNLKNALDFHENHQRAATLITATTNQLARHRVVTTNAAGIITNTEKQPARYANAPETVGLINAGMMISDKETVLTYAGDRDKDWGGLLDTLVTAGELAAYEDSEMNFFNVGTPEEYQEAQAFLHQQQASAA